MAVDKVQKEKKIKADRLTAIAVMSELDALFGRMSLDEGEERPQRTSTATS